jgi:hypothetical protein
MDFFAHGELTLLSYNPEWREYLHSQISVLILNTYIWMYLYTPILERMKHMLSELRSLKFKTLLKQY